MFVPADLRGRDLFGDEPTSSTRTDFGEDSSGKYPDITLPMLRVTMHDLLIMFHGAGPVCARVSRWREVPIVLAIMILGRKPVPLGREGGRCTAMRRSGVPALLILHP